MQPTTKEPEGEEEVESPATPPSPPPSEGVLSSSAPSVPTTASEPKTTDSTSEPRGETAKSCSNTIASATSNDCSSSSTTTDNSEEHQPGKMFVGALSWQTTPEKLNDYFKKFGEISQCIVMRDPTTKRSRGFGFVTFRDPAVVYKVLDGGPHQVDQKKVDPKIAVPRKQQSKLVTKTRKMFIGGISASTSSHDLNEYFSKFGKIEDVMLMCDKGTQRHRGFGFVTFDTEESVDKVCAQQFHEINEKTVECKKAQPKEVMMPQALASKARNALTRSLAFLPSSSGLPSSHYINMNGISCGGGVGGGGHHIIPNGLISGSPGGDYLTNYPAGPPQYLVSDIYAAAAAASSPSYPNLDQHHHPQLHHHDHHNRSGCSCSSGGARGGYMSSSINSGIMDRNIGGGSGPPSLDSSTTSFIFAGGPPSAYSRENSNEAPSFVLAPATGGSLPPPLLGSLSFLSASSNGCGRGGGYGGGGMTSSSSMELYSPTGGEYSPQHHHHLRQHHQQPAHYGHQSSLHIHSSSSGSGYQSQSAAAAEEFNGGAGGGSYIYGLPHPAHNSSHYYHHSPSTVNGLTLQYGPSAAYIPATMFHQQQSIY